MTTLLSTASPTPSAARDLLPQQRAAQQAENGTRKCVHVRPSGPDGEWTAVEQAPIRPGVLRRREPNPWAALDERPNQDRRDDAEMTGHLLRLPPRELVLQWLFAWLVVTGVFVILATTFAAIGDGLGLWTLPHWIVDLGNAGSSG